MTSLGVAEELVSEVDGWDDIEADAARTSSCWSFSDPMDTNGLNGQNAQVAKLIVALRESGSGRRAILRAVAERQGIVSERELDNLADGSAD